MTSPTAGRMFARKRPTRPKFLDLYGSSPLRRLAASTTAGGMLLVGTPLMVEYVVRPGDTLSDIAQSHDTSVDALVQKNDLHASGDRVSAGETLTIPSAHGRGGGVSSSPDTGTGSGTDTGTDPDARRIVSYTVRPGDTATGLATRFHAWTAELISRNDLDPANTLTVGEKVQIPVVLAAVSEDDGNPGVEESAPAPEATAAEPSLNQEQRTLKRRLGHRADPSQAQVRGVIERTSRRYGVDPHLALAVSWQEAGWQQHHVSHASAIGAMQVIPTTGEWMSGVIGRDLDLLDVGDNVTAGVALLRELNGSASPRNAIAGYYQGLASVRERGMYEDTKAYVANVVALKRAFERGDYPA